MLVSFCTSFTTNDYGTFFSRLAWLQWLRADCGHMFIDDVLPMQNGANAFVGEHMLQAFSCFMHGHQLIQLVMALSSKSALVNVARANETRRGICGILTHILICSGRVDESFYMGRRAISMS